MKFNMNVMALQIWRPREIWDGSEYVATWCVV